MYVQVTSLPSSPFTSSPWSRLMPLSLPSPSSPSLLLCPSPSLLPLLSPHIPSLSSIQGKGGKFCHLRVHVLPDNYVYFESMEYPGQYVTMTSTGSVGNPVHAGPNDKNTQFFVRLEVRAHFYGDVLQCACTHKWEICLILHSHDQSEGCI